jgi:dethiobiotin synthetase
VRGFFVTATGTGAGKTTLTAALAQALRAEGHDVAALKPIETGVEGFPADARALAQACGHPELESDPRWYRARAPLSPYAAQLEGERAIDLGAIARAVREHATGRIALVEGAGGLLVPLDGRATIADLAVELALPILLVAPDRLGTLSEILTAMESADRRGLQVAAVVLGHPTSSPPDDSARTNALVLRTHRPHVPIVGLRHGRITHESLRPLLTLL